METIRLEAVNNSEMRGRQGAGTKLPMPAGKIIGGHWLFYKKKNWKMIHLAAGFKLINIPDMIFLKCDQIAGLLF